MGVIKLLLARDISLLHSSPMHTLAYCCFCLKDSQQLPLEKCSYKKNEAVTAFQNEQMGSVTWKTNISIMSSWHNVEAFLHVHTKRTNNVNKHFHATFSLPRTQASPLDVSCLLKPIFKWVCTSTVSHIHSETITTWTLHKWRNHELN